MTHLPEIGVKPRHQKTGSGFWRDWHANWYRIFWYQFLLTRHALFSCQFIVPVQVCWYRFSAPIAGTCVMGIMKGWIGKLSRTKMPDPKTRRGRQWTKVTSNDFTDTSEFREQCWTTIAAVQALLPDPSGASTYHTTEHVRRPTRTLSKTPVFVVVRF